MSQAQILYVKGRSNFPELESLLLPLGPFKLPKEGFPKEELATDAVFSRYSTCLYESTAILKTSAVVVLFEVNVPQHARQGLRCVCTGVAT